MMRNIIKIVFQIIGSILLAAFILWLISYLIGVNIYVREMLRIPELVPTHSGKSSPLIPVTCPHLSERSDASFILYQRS